MRQKVHVHFLKAQQRATERSLRIDWVSGKHTEMVKERMCEVADTLFAGKQ
jgi:hypothetical protein